MEDSIFHENNIVLIYSVISSSDLCFSVTRHFFFERWFYMGGSVYPIPIYVLMVFLTYIVKLEKYFLFLGSLQAHAAQYGCRYRI